MPFSGGEVSQKGFPRGWDADAEDQASQRQFRIAQLLEAMVFRPFSWDRFNSLNLKYAFHGGLIDNGSEWLLIDDGSVTLQDNKTNWIERTDAGNVVVNQTGFTYLNHVPMAVIAARSGSFAATTYVDRRPEIGGAPSSISDTISFAQIVGEILASQVPLEVVQQWQFQLCHLPGNILPGVFGANSLCNPGATGNYTFPLDLDVLQDLFVGRDAIVTEDLAVLENLNVLGIFTAEGVAVFEALATFLAAVVMEDTLNVEGVFTAEAAAVFLSTLNVEGTFTAESLAIFAALATFQAAAVFESTVNVEGIFTAEAASFFLALATFQSAALFQSSVNVEGITTLEDQVRRGLRTITAADTPYTLVETDWHLNIDISLGSVEVLIPDAAAHSSGGFTDQLHFKIIGSGFGDPFVTLTPSVLGQEIDGFEAAILRRNNLSFTLVSDGSGWWIQ